MSGYEQRCEGCRFSELYHGKQIPEADMEKILRPVGLWQEYGRKA